MELKASSFFEPLTADIMIRALIDPGRDSDAVWRVHPAANIHVFLALGTIFVVKRFEMQVLQSDGMDEICFLAAAIRTIPPSLRVGKALRFALLIGK